MYCMLFLMWAVYQSPYKLVEAVTVSILATLSNMDSLQVMRGGLKTPCDGYGCSSAIEHVPGILKAPSLIVSSEEGSLKKSVQ